MAQITGVETWVDASVWYSEDDTTWTDISGYCAGVSIGGGGRNKGQAFTFEGDYAVIGKGKRQPVDVTVNAAYTEGATDLFTIARTAAEGKTQFQLRFSPEGGDAAEFIFSTDTDSFITNEIVPVGTADSADPAFFEISVFSRRLIKGSAT